MTGDDCGAVKNNLNACDLWLWDVVACHKAKMHKERVYFSYFNNNF